MGLLELHGKSWKDSHSYVITGRREKASGVGGVSLFLCACVFMCVFPVSLLFFFKKEGGRDLNPKECAKSRNVNRSGAFGPLLRRQRSKCVQLDCLCSSADKTEQASSAQPSGIASGWMLPSPEEAITHIPG